MLVGTSAETTTSVRSLGTTHVSCEDIKHVLLLVSLFNRVDIAMHEYLFPMANNDRNAFDTLRFLQKCIELFEYGLNVFISSVYFRPRHV